MGYLPTPNINLKLDKKSSGIGMDQKYRMINMVTDLTIILN